jgi:CheY-like chemotaxis protein
MNSTEQRILLVEDHEDTCKVTARLLHMEGYIVRTALTAASALKACDEESFDLVICDIGLPDGNGHDLMRTLKHRCGIKGIGLSGYGMEADQQKGAEAGFVEYLIKPIDLKALTAAITRAIPKV